MTTCWQDKLSSLLLTSTRDNFRTGAIFCALIILAAVSFPIRALSASNQMQPVLKAIDPSQAKYDTPKPAPQKSPDTTKEDSQSSGPNYKYQPYDDTASGGPVPPTFAPSSVYGSDSQSPTGTPPGSQSAQFPSPSMIPSFDQPLPKPTEDAASPAGQEKAQGWMPTEQIPVAPSPTESRALARLEQTVFGATYPDHDFGSRIDHLEKESLGNTSTGSYSERIRALTTKIGVPTAFGTPANPSPPSGSGDNTAATDISGNDATRIIQGMPAHPKAGDYLSLIRTMGPGIYPHWSTYPVRIHLPQDCPDTWRKELESGVESWSKSVPLSIVASSESSDIEVIWVNHLVPRLLGIARVIVTDGKMRSQIFLLRPTFYLREVPERALAQVFMHELGHALGLAGHSDTKSDIMYPIEITPDGKTTFAPSRNALISPRDVNTLKQVYSSPELPPHFSLPAPVEWGFSRSLKEMYRRDAAPARPPAEGR
jgi:predicted Zn-dependent protease